MEDSDVARRIPLPHSQEDIGLSPPRAPYMGSETPVDGSEMTPSPNNSTQLLPLDKAEQDGAEKTASAPTSSNSKLRWILLAAAALVVVVLAVILPVYFTVIKPKHNNNNASVAVGSGSNSGGNSGNNGNNGNNGNSTGSSGSGSSQPNTPTVATTGGDGSTITTDDGSTFTYNNKFGGFWVYDPQDPYNNGAQPNSWTPPLNTSWTWGKDRVYGVNLGGLFVLEPFIVPSLFQKYPGAVDEWSLSTLMAQDTASGGLQQIEDHYNTFIVEQDIAQIAGAGLNWVRLPIPFWAINKMAPEPFLERTSWKYILRVIGWCRKYGLRVNLDLHTIPGGQNGFNHGGKLGALNFMVGPMGMANAERASEYMRTLTEFISQPEFQDVVPVFGIMNEALLHTIGRDSLTSFYLEEHKDLRAITGFGAGNGPYISIHDGFDGPANWAGFLEGSDRIILDYHPYFAFDGQANDEPIATGTGNSAGGQWPQQACTSWGNTMRNSQKNFGITIAGEFSNAFNDCGLYVRGVGGTATTPDCDQWTDSSQWDDSTKAGLQAFIEASMDALGDWFFWTWKIGNSTKGIVEAPLWSYQLGLENGWVPQDPRDAVGKCQQLGVQLDTFDGQYQPWQTGGNDAGTIAASSTSEYPWPPNTIVSATVPPTLLPTYTQTGTPVTLPPPTLTPAPTNSLDGWFNNKDTVSAWTPIQACTYPDAWNPGTDVPPLCPTDSSAPTQLRRAPY